MNGKSKCKILKEIRKEIAKNNDIEFVTSECKYQGDCLGTCPKCEAEVKYLEAELLKRKQQGKNIAVAGLAAALVVTAAGCANEKIPTSSTFGTRGKSEITSSSTTPSKPSDNSSLPEETEGKVDPTVSSDLELMGEIDFELMGDVIAPPSESEPETFTSEISDFENSIQGMPPVDYFDDQQ